MDGFEFKRHIDRAAELNPRSENIDQALYFLLLRTQQGSRQKETLGFLVLKNAIVFAVFRIRIH